MGWGAGREEVGGEGECIMGVKECWGRVYFAGRQYTEHLSYLYHSLTFAHLAIRVRMGSGNEVEILVLGGKVFRQTHFWCKCMRPCCHLIQFFKMHPFINNERYNL